MAGAGCVELGRVLGMVAITVAVAEVPCVGTTAAGADDVVDGASILQLDQLPIWLSA